MKNKIKVLFIIFISLNLLSCKEEKKPNNCEDPSYCVLSKMPLMSQSSFSLAKVIRENTNDDRIRYDSGWCGPVAAAMAFAGYKREFPNVNFNSAIDTATEIDPSSSASTNGGKYGEIIYHLGELFQTNWHEGGTYDSKREIGINQILESITTEKSKHVHDIKLKTYRDNNYFIDIFNAHKPAFNISIYKYVKDQNNQYKIDGGHAVVVNGTDEGHLKIYDPWGRIYNVDMLEDGGAHNPPLIQHIGSNTAGYLASALKGSNKVKAQRINYLFVE